MGAQDHIADNKYSQIVVASSSGLETSPKHLWFDTLQYASHCTCRENSRFLWPLLQDLDQHSP